ncbi:hypothetical protein BGX27_010119 [Mortierella sp. AM989]|nr:hypothetical protein BGX27_010119 [Mortierella sp. AM989]
MWTSLNFRLYNIIMSDESNPLTLSLEDEISELPDSQELHDAPVTSVKLVSLNPSFNDIALKDKKTVLGRNKEKSSEGAVLIGAAISGVHCEISSRSLSEAEAIIWIKDISTNGVWVNEKRIPKDEPVKIFHRDIISFAHGSVKNRGNNPAFMLMDTRNTKRVNDELNVDSSAGPDSKKQKLDDGSTEDANKSNEDSSFEKEFECGICHDIMYKALALQPCLHSFCKECCKAWFQTSSECPSCRQHVRMTKRDFRLNNLITLFLKNRPQLKRDDVEEDGAESDTSNVIKTSGNRNRNRNDDDDDDGDDSSSDDSDSDAVQNIWSATLPLGFIGLPATCPCCDANNNLGYICPAAVRLDPLPPQATFVDYNSRRQIQPGHTQCQHCRRHLPVIPATAQASVADHFRCKMCYIPSCGCRLDSIDDKITHQSPIDGFLNRFEIRVINDYLVAEQLTVQSVWQEIKDGMDNGSFQYLRPNQDSSRIQNTTISSSDKICQDCARHFLSNGPLYQWRKNLDSSKLPSHITSRQPCWYGRECRTQHNITNLSHAERLNHICENTRRD